MLKVSATSLQMYWRCPEEYRKIYVSEELKRMPPTPEMCAGTAVHAAIDFAHKQKLLGNNPSLAEMLGEAEGVDIPLVICEAALDALETERLYRSQP